MLIGNVKFDDACPEGCPGAAELFIQGGLCHRCPIFNCCGEYTLLAPESYRTDWAKAWRLWFDSGMHGYPNLYLNKV